MESERKKRFMAILEEHPELYETAIEMMFELLKTQEGKSK